MTPTISRAEGLGKILLDDGSGYGLRVGYGFGKHTAFEISYDFLPGIAQISLPDRPTTDIQQLMANLLYNVKDDRGFIPYLFVGVGAQRFSNAKEGLEDGAIAGFGLGARFLVADPVSLRFEVKDIVRYSDFGHTFYWTFGLEFSFGKIEEPVAADSFTFYREQIKEPPGSYPSASNEPVKTSTKPPLYRRGIYKHTKKSGVIAKIDTGRLYAKRGSATPSIVVSAGGGGSETASTREAANSRNRHYRADKRPIAAAEVKAKRVAQSSRERGEADLAKKESLSYPLDGSQPQIASGASAPLPGTLDMSVEETAAGGGGDLAASGSKSAEREGDLYGLQNAKEYLDGESSAERQPFEDAGRAKIIVALVTFDFDSDRIRPNQLGRVEELAKYLKSHPELTLVIEGHTDSIGSESYNLKLSQRRASKLKEALVALGIRPDRIETKGLGESRPIASNDTAEGRSKNRRDDVVIKSSER